MLTHPLFEQLKTLRCQGMLEALQEQLNRFCRKKLGTGVR